MAEQESWIERRQRMVRCKTHGLHYDPRMSSGCILCVKAWGKLVPQRAPQFTLVLLCILGMAVILYQVFGPGQSVGGPLITETAEAADPRLDPEPYRQGIEALETGLFAPVEDGRDLADVGASFRAGTDVLSGAVWRLDPQDAATADAVAALGRSVTEGLGFADLERLRYHWLRLRQRRFLPATWFLSPAEEGQMRDRVMLVEHRELARRLRALLYEGAAAAQAIAESEAAEGAVEWREFTADWGPRLEGLWRDAPQRPDADADAAVLLAIQELERAFQRTRTLASDSGLVSGGDPGARFDEILLQIDKVESAFAGVRL